MVAIIELLLEDFWVEAVCLLTALRRLDRDFELACADEVHERFLILLVDILVVVFLGFRVRVCVWVVVLLEEFAIWSREYVLKLADKLGDELFSEPGPGILDLRLHHVEAHHEDLVGSFFQQVSHHVVGLNRRHKRGLDHSFLQRWFRLVEEVGHLRLQALRCVRVVDVLADLGPNVTRQIQVDHGRIGQVNFGGELGRFFVELVHVSGHVTDDNGVDDGADRLEQERDTELRRRGSWHDLTDCEDVVGCVEHD